MQLLAWRSLTPRPPEVLYWRTREGEEVDFVLESPRRLLPIEIKTSRQVGVNDAQSLEVFVKEYPKQAPYGIVLYTGEEVIPLTAHVLAVPVGLAFGV